MQIFIKYSQMYENNIVLKTYLMKKFEKTYFKCARNQGSK